MMMLVAIMLAAITHVPKDGTFRYPTNRCATAELAPAQVLGGCALNQATNRRVGPETHASIIGSADAWFDRFVLATLTGTGRETNRDERVTRSMFETGAITNFLNQGSVAWELAFPSNRDFRANGPRWIRRPVSVQDAALSYNGEYYFLNIGAYDGPQFLSPWKNAPDDRSIAWGSSAISGFDTFSHPQWARGFWSMRSDWNRLYPIYWSLTPSDGERQYDFSRLFDNLQFRSIVWREGEDEHLDDMIDAVKGRSGGARGSTAELISMVSGNSAVTNRFRDYHVGYALNPIRRLLWSQWSAVNGTLAALDRVYVTQDLCPRLSYTNQTQRGSRQSSFNIRVENIQTDEQGGMDFSSCTVTILSENIGTNEISDVELRGKDYIEASGALAASASCGASFGFSYEWTAVSNLNGIASAGLHPIELWTAEDPWDFGLIHIGAFIDGSYEEHIVDTVHRVTVDQMDGAISLSVSASADKTISTAAYDYATPGSSGASMPARYPHPASVELLLDRDASPEIFAMTWEGVRADDAYGAMYGNYARINAHGPLRSVDEFNSAIRTASDNLINDFTGRALAALDGFPLDVRGLLGADFEGMARRQGLQSAQDAFRNLGTQYPAVGIHPKEDLWLKIDPDGSAHVGYLHPDGSFHDTPLFIISGLAIQPQWIDIGFQNKDFKFSGGLMTTASVHWNFNTMKRKQ